MKCSWTALGTVRQVERNTVQYNTPLLSPWGKSGKYQISHILKILLKILRIVQKCSRTHAHTHTRTHTRTHARTHAHTHTHTQLYLEDFISPLMRVLKDFNITIYSRSEYLFISYHREFVSFSHFKDVCYTIQFLAFLVHSTPFPIVLFTKETT